ncbi:RusA family crossover junction endodeoxyribonuclease [Salipaludibacillus aurantiacus]|uniref:Holliday junction resolvase RusA (Prophage-encoded endonuclease) n=1 Tax=Salipaludibacillus aurantiacus TaxID=1601833 RepID=A0A1H9U1D1_9BACI|nr:RusA family crossover junction endodeoxyribonuclease [Salipaludibacillus aurantiacus]SES02964.1 Holliday junction resolvase RusA (prophage-encoded endonuclease) [Salipaludibacillus aurantiacus]
MKIVVPGRPVPAVRMTRRGAHVKPNAQRYLNYKSSVGWAAKAQKVKLIAGAVKVDIKLYLSGGNQGDIDNYAKSLTDGLNKIAYNDDRQIRKMNIEKIECEKDEQRAEIIVEELTGVKA